MSSFSREWAPNRCRTQQNDPKSLQNAAKLCKSQAERSKTTPNLCRTQQNDTQISAEHSKTTPNPCRTQQNDTKSMQNTTKWHQIFAERNKTIPNYSRPQHDDTKLQQTAATRHQITKSLQNAHPLENELILQRMSTKSLQNAAKWPQINAEHSKTTPN